MPQHLHRVHPAPGAALLEHHADAGEQLPPLRDGVETEDAHAAGLRPPVALAGLQRGRLAGPVGTEHGRDRAALDDQVETVDGDHVAVGHPESADLDSRRRGSGHPREVVGSARLRPRCPRAPRPTPAPGRRRPAARARGRAPAPWMARQTRSGVQGRSTCRTPRWRSASTTAFCTAGVDPMVADSPMPLAPSGLTGVGVSVLLASSDDRVGGGRQRVVDEGRGQRRALVVVDHLLPQRLGDALDRAAVLLAGDQQRVEDPSAVVDGDVAQRADPAGVEVDLDDRDVRAEGEGREGQLVVGGDRQPALVLVGVGRELLPRQPRVRDARDRERAVVEDHVLGCGLQHPCGQLDRLLLQLVGGLADRVAADLQRARAARAAAPSGSTRCRTARR